MTYKKSQNSVNRSVSAQDPISVENLGFLEKICFCYREPCFSLLHYQIRAKCKNYVSDPPCKTEPQINSNSCDLRLI